MKVAGAPLPRWSGGGPDEPAWDSPQVDDAAVAGAMMTVPSAAPGVEGRLREHVHELMRRLLSPVTH